jgi:hypothetical protein
MSRSLANPPWKHYNKPEAASVDTLRHWRKVAERGAVAKGAPRACGLCKRATVGVASVDIRQPWRSRTKLVRWLCSEHWQMLTQLIAEWERTLDNYDLPIAKIGRGSTKGSGVRGTCIER